MRELDLFRFVLDSNAQQRRMLDFADPLPHLEVATAGPSASLSMVGGCVADQLGLQTVGAAGAIAAGREIPGSKRFVQPGSASGTSWAGRAANAVFGKLRAPIPLPTLTG